jgi:pimeloyl-ACP methyl ester carboxylesterase
MTPDSSAVSRRLSGLAVYQRAPLVASTDGEAAVVVFVHGSMDRAATFAKVGRHLPTSRLVRYDRRGYGRSAAAGIAPSIDAQADDLISVIDGRRSVVVGHSFGGVVALAAASRCLYEVAAVGAFEAPMPWASWWPHASAGGQAVEAAIDGGPEAAAELFMRRMVGDDRWERLSETARDRRRAEGRALVAELSAMRDATVAPYDVAAIAGPVVAGYGTEGRPYHRRASEELARAAHHGELFEIDGAGHDAQNSHPGDFAEFVGRVISAGSVPA